VTRAARDVTANAKATWTTIGEIHRGATRVPAGSANLSGLPVRASCACFVARWVVAEARHHRGDVFKVVEYRATEHAGDVVTPMYIGLRST
jgi:hypothetical protein